MKQDELNKIASRYASKKATKEERQYFDAFLDQVNAINDKPASSQDRFRASRLYQNIQQHVKPGRKKNALRYMVAAGISIAILLASLFSASLLSSPKILQQTLRGEKKTIALPDGSMVILNGASRLSYPEEFGDTREVELDGEAFFKVKRDPARPFMVHTSSLQTRVHGTSFNVNAYTENKAKVSVNTGKVEVQYKELAHTRSLLYPDEQLILDKNRLSRGKVNSADLSAWTRNTIFIDNKDLEEVAAILENWFAVDIDFETESLKKLNISGKYRDESLENIFRSMEMLKDIHIDSLTSKQFIIRVKKD